MSAKRMKRLAAGLCMLTFVAGAQAEVDQEHTTTTNMSTANLSEYSWTQTLHAGMRGALVGVELYIKVAGSAELAVICNGKTFNGILSGDAGEWVYVDVSSAGIEQEDGDLITIEITGRDDDLYFGRSSYNSYTSGQLDYYVKGKHVETNEGDMSFRTYVERILLEECGPIKRMKSACSRTRRLRVLVKLKGTKQDGKFVEISVNDVLHEVEINGKRAVLILTKRSGGQKIFLSKPSGCLGGNLVNCH